jgi:4-diphosphocytidyl-2-C-methyl-D-erythritol kinase
VIARVRAQAKINLMLRVLAREESGYHQIETIFQRLDLSDLVTVRVAGTGMSVDVVGPAMPAGGLGPPERNLAWRAAEGFAAHAGWPGGWQISIEKHIPVGGGLGGGSANAAAVLRALNAMAPRPLIPETLLEIASGLGADVPFLIQDFPLALGWGRGERLIPMATLPVRDVVLFCFDFGVSTAEAYGWLSAARGGLAPSGRVLYPERLLSWSGIADVSGNDFEQVVPARFPLMDSVLTSLRGPRRSFGEDAIAILCGSGATVALIAEDLSLERARSLFRDGESVRLLATRTASRVEEVLVEG